MLDLRQSPRFLAESRLRWLRMTEAQVSAQRPELAEFVNGLRGVLLMDPLPLPKMDLRRGRRVE